MNTAILPEEPDPIVYRIPMPVTELVIFRNRDSSYICPRCTLTLTREFMAYCDRCGQKLSWRSYRKARRIYWKD